MINEKEVSTEEKIKIAAKKIFQQKGYAGARTRDIAEEAGINLALLNYYYRSKEKLFQLVMKDSFRELFATIRAEVDNTENSLTDKITLIVELYFRILKENPNLLLFVLDELKSHPDKLIVTLGLPENFLQNTHLYYQLKEQLVNNGMEQTNPYQILMNIFSLILFPFIAQPIFRLATGSSVEQYESLLEERRKLVPMWIKCMLRIQEDTPD